MFWPFKSSVKIPPTHANYDFSSYPFLIADFLSFTDKAWYLCRDVFQSRILKISEDKRHILYLRAPEGASKMHIQPVQDIEQELNIDTLDRTNFFPTDEKRITYIEMSKFWLASPMRLSVFSSVFKARGYVGPYFDTDLKKEFLAKFKSGCVNTAIHYNPDFGIFENLKLLPDVSKLICR